MAVDEVFPPRIAEPEEIVQVSAPGPTGWHLARLTDTPIQILAIYLFMSLLLPAILLAIDGDLWPIFYRYEDFSVVEGAVVFSAVILPCILRHLEWARTKEIPIKPRAVFIYSAQQLRIAGLLVAIAVAIINIGNSGFRYDEVSLSERGSFSLYVYAIVPACVKLLLIYHAFLYRGTSGMDRLERALVTAALAVSINGNATAFVTVFSFIALQTNARALLFKSTFGAVSYLRLTILAGIGAVFVGIVSIVLTGAYIYGESVKRGESVNSVFDSLTGASFGEGWTPTVLFDRLVPPYASLVNTLPLTFDFDQDSFANLIGVANTFLFRVEALDLFRFGIDRGDTMPMSRLNLEFINSVALTAREGTAPGLIPGFLYCFPPVLNVLMLALYVFLTLGILQRLCLCMNDEMSFIGKFILSYFALPLFESPIDFLLIIDDGFIFFVGLWWMGRLVEQVHPTQSTAWEAQPDTN